MACLNEAAFNEAYDTWERSKSDARDSLRAAICTYLDDTPSARPDTNHSHTVTTTVETQTFDHRKELWVGVAIAVARAESAREADRPGKWADVALAAFDKTFPKGTTP